MRSSCARRLCATTPSFWLQALRQPTAAAVAPPDRVAAAGATAKGLGQPWVISRQACDELEAGLGLETFSVLEALTLRLQHWLGSPVIAGLGSKSRAVYLAPGLSLGTRSRLTPSQVLVANLFAAGEPGLEAICASEVPSKASVDLLRELADFDTIRWVDADSQQQQAAAGSQQQHSDFEFASMRSLDGFGFRLPAAAGPTRLADVVGDGGG